MAVASFQVNKKPFLKNFILIVLVLLVWLCALKMFHITEMRAKSTCVQAAAVDCYRAEIFMRIAEIIELLSGSGIVHQANEKELSSKNYAIAKADELIDQVAAEEPDNLVILCKKIILKAEAGQNLKSDLDKLIGVASSGKKIPIQEQKLAKLVWLLYSQKSEKWQNSEFMELSTQANSIFKDTISNGWFSDSALLKVYKLEGQNENYEHLLLEIKNKNWQYFFKLVLIGGVAGISAIVGLVIIIYQLIISNAGLFNDLGKKALFLPVMSESAVSEGLYKYNWRIVSLVFLAWFFTQIFIAYISSVLKQHGMFISYASSLSSAISIFVIYLLSNGSVFLYIYFLAVKPNGLRLTDCIKLKLNVGNYGPIALVIIGLFGVLAALPVVLTACLISVNCFGSSGSSNPVIGIVMKAALENDFVAILLFYFTLSFLAPFCEESLFRGFFYTYLRGRHGSLFSNLLSSVLFALFHFDPGAMLQLFCLGSVFAYIREKTGSIVPSIIAHGIWNGATFTLVLLLLGN